MLTRVSAGFADPASHREGINLDYVVGAFLCALVRPASTPEDTDLHNSLHTSEYELLLHDGDSR